MRYRYRMLLCLVFLLSSSIILAAEEVLPELEEDITIVDQSAPVDALPKDKTNVADPAEKAQAAPTTVVIKKENVYVSLPTYPKNIRQPIGVNVFYPSDVQVLYSELEALEDMQALPKVPGVGKVFIAPWGEIGGALPTAAKVYRYIRDNGGAKTVVLLSSPYAKPMAFPASVWPSGGYATPLKVSPVNALAAMKLLKQPLFSFDATAHAADPAIETNVLVMQKFLPEAQIVPVLINPQNKKQVEDIAQALAEIVQAPDVVLVIVTNLSSGLPSRTEAGAFDLDTLSNISTLNLNIMNNKGLQAQMKLPKGVLGVTAPKALLTGVLSGLMLEMDTATWLGYASVRQTPGKPLLTGCVAGVFSERAAVKEADKQLLQIQKPELSSDAVTELGTLTRTSLEAAVARALYDAPYPVSAQLMKKRGAFVTVLGKNDKILASMGTLNPVERLYVSAVEAARMCGTAEDPQMNFKLTPQQARDNKFVISVIKNFRTAADWQDVKNGDGVMIGRGQRRCVVLPLVAKLNKWSVEDMLSFACRRAGLRPDAYRIPSVDIFLFNTDDYYYQQATNKETAPLPAEDK